MVCISWAYASARMAAASQRLGELFATGSSDGKLRLIDAATGDLGREVAESGRQAERSC